MRIGAVYQRQINMPRGGTEQAGDRVIMFVTADGIEQFESLLTVRKEIINALGAILFTLGYGGCMIADGAAVDCQLAGPKFAHAGNFAIGLMLTAFVSGLIVERLYKSPASG